MSHHQEPIICPNCGFHATENYCARCGQETHLHTETFWGLVMHFIGHYFHYDSKFRKTISALWFSPGKLTIAYWNKQRMRYITPISLYLFISAVFFLLVIINPHKIMKGDKGEITFSNSTHPKQIGAQIKHEDSVHQANNDYPWYQYDKRRDTANFMHFIVVNGEKLDRKTDNNSGEYLVEHIYHTIPKVFFFMIPLMALFLKLLFVGRKDIYFINHSIFSLHYHCFVFSVSAFLYIPIVRYIPHLTIIVACTALIYLIAALKKVYGTNWVLSMLYSLLLCAGYGMFLLAVMIVDFLAILYFA